MTEFRLTRHAATRAVDMALLPEDIRELMIRPDSKRLDNNPDHPKDWLLFAPVLIGLLWVHRLQKAVKR